MKKTIAAILVTILASAGYIVLDKASVEKINRLESQVAVQQQVIDSYGGSADTLDMKIGETLRCYPSEGMTVVAYVLDQSMTRTFSYESTTGKPVDPTDGCPTEPSTRSESTTTATTYHSDTVYAQADEPTATTAKAEEITGPTAPTSNPTFPTPTSITTLPVTTLPPSTTVPITTKPASTTSPSPTVSPESTIIGTTWWYTDEELYHLRTDVLIRSFRCEMTGKSLTGIPQFTITLTGKVDPAFAGREISASFGRVTTIRSDGSFTIIGETTRASASTIALDYIYIY